MQQNLNIEKIAFKVVQMKFLAMHITNQKLGFDIFTVEKFTKYLHGTSSLLNILMIFGIKEKFWPIQCIFGYCYKYTRATYDWFCGPGSHIWLDIWELWLTQSFTSIHVFMGELETLDLRQCPTLGPFTLLNIKIALLNVNVLFYMNTHSVNSYQQQLNGSII